MQQRILITGGAGFIGSRLSLQLIQQGYNVTILDNLSPQIHGNDPQKSTLYRSIKDSTQFIFGDVQNSEDWDKALKDVDIVVHLAAETGTGQSMYEIQKYTAVNTQGTAILLDKLTNTKHHIKKVIVASSRAIYGEGEYFSPKMQQVVFPNARKEEEMMAGDFDVKCPISNTIVDLKPTTENCMIKPNSIYGLTKYFQEQAIMITSTSLNIPCVALRYQNVYGPGQSLSNPYTGILSIFSTRILQDKPINIFEDGKESRDFVYIDDVVEATIAAIKNEKANYNSINIGTCIATDVITVAQTLAKNYNKDADITITGQFRKGDIRHNFADITKAKALLDFEPKVSFEEGIKHFCHWVLQQELKEDLYEKSLTEMKEKGLFK